MHLKKLLKSIIPTKYYSLNQLDKKIEKYLDYENGFFVELGANDGIKQSNTLYFEKNKNWQGVLVEPSPHNYLKCLRNRSSKNNIYCAACVSFNYPSEFVRMMYSDLMTASYGLDSDIPNIQDHIALGQKFLKEQEINFEYGAIAQCLNDLLHKAKAPKIIDFLSLDVEGSELEVLKGINHSDYRFKYILVECRDFEKMKKYLSEQGYIYLEKLSNHDYLFSSIDNHE